MPLACFDTNSNNTLKTYQKNRPFGMWHIKSKSNTKIMLNCVEMW